MKKQKYILLLITLFVLCIFTVWSPIGEFVLWQIDRALAFKNEKVVYQNRDLTISFVQKADMDFYTTSFLVTYANGKQSEIFIDGDSSRWWNVKVHRNGLHYVVRGSSLSGDIEESYFDSSSKELYIGQHQLYYSLDGTRLRQK